MTHARDERGAAAVEFALVFPLLVLMLCTIIDFGMRYQYVHQLNDAAAVAARDMSIRNDATLAKAAGVGAGAPTDSGTSWSITPCVTNGNTTVTISTTRATTTKFFGSSFDVTAKAVARCQL
jgi:Flp pilus assembly protein TadG